jgi:hypothetical protein
MEFQNLRCVRLTDEEVGSFDGVVGEFTIRAGPELSALSVTDPAFLDTVMRQLLHLLQEHFSALPQD